MEDAGPELRRSVTNPRSPSPPSAHRDDWIFGDDEREAIVLRVFDPSLSAPGVPVSARQCLALMSAAWDRTSGPRLPPGLPTPPPGGFPLYSVDDKFGVYPYATPHKGETEVREGGFGTASRYVP